MRRILSISIVLSLIVIILILNLTSPAGAGPLGILVLFLCAYTFLVGAISWAIYFISRFVSKISYTLAVRKPIGSLSFKKSYYFSTFIALAPIILTGLHSVGAGSFYGYILVSIFEVIGVVYISKLIQ